MGDLDLDPVRSPPLLTAEHAAISQPSLPSTPPSACRACHRQPAGVMACRRMTETEAHSSCRPPYPFSHEISLRRDLRTDLRTDLP